MLEKKALSLQSGQIFLIIAFVFCLIVPSTATFETDELFTGLFARTPSLSDLYVVWAKAGGSDKQMPLTLLTDYLWGHLVGTSEWQLRSFNLIWAALALYSFYRLGTHLKLPWLPLFLAIQPFFWYYLNQARPYAMQIGLSSVPLCILAFHVYRPHSFSTGETFAFFASGFLLSATTMMGFIAFVPYLMTLGILVLRGKEKPGRAAVIIAAGGLILLTLLGLLYCSTLGSAGGARVHSVGIMNLVFPFYEFFGFMGLSIERFALRELSYQGMGAIWRAMVPYLYLQVILVLAYVGIAIGYWRSPKNKPDHSVFLLCCILVTAIAAMILVPALIVKFPTWGRHYSPAFPAFVLALALAMSGRTRSLLNRLFFALLFLLLFFSAARLRFDPQYGREDFRGVSEFSLQQLGQGKTVWWAGDIQLLGYYHLPTGVDPADKDKVLAVDEYLGRSSDKQLEKLPEPDWIIRFVRVPENPTVAAYRELHRYRAASQFVGFTVYQKP